jgi:hypothetical protein
LLRLAIKKGEISRPDRCQRCGKITKPQGHHDDYAKPFEVAWLCQSCHAKEHFSPCPVLAQPNLNREDADIPKGVAPSVVNGEARESNSSADNSGDSRGGENLCRSKCVPRVSSTAARASVSEEVGRASLSCK